MKKYLIIAEKPDMGRKIAKAILKGGGVDKKRYIEGENCYITWAIGHLIGLAPPDHYDEKYKEWTELPINPAQFKLIADPKTRNQLNVIKDLSSKTSILINAADAGREGQLIFEYIYRYLKLNHPVMRMWTSSVTENALRTAFKNLKNNKEYYDLYLSAKTRAEADWLVGMNGTRVCSTKFNQLISVGRVQTPTLSLIYDRTKKIENFSKKVFYEVKTTMNQNGIEYEATWQGNEIEDQSKAEEIVNKVKGKSGQVTKVERETVRESPPKLYDLGLLQQEANKEFGYGASKTLKIAQSLYEKHEVITYPRTDNNFVTEEEIPYMHEVFKIINTRLNAPFFMESRPELVSPHNKRICQEASDKDHHAILPTEKTPSGLNEEEKKLYLMIVKRFMAQFFPQAEYEQTEIETKIEGEVFLTKSKRLVELGWKTVYGETLSDADNPLGNITVSGVECVAAEAVQKETKPPKHYTEGTLIAAMKNVSRELDGEFKELLKEKGIGTSATRASIVDRLKSVGYIENKGRYLLITNKGKQVIEMLRSHGLEQLTSAEFTGEWEKRLGLIEQGKENHDLFIKDIVSFVHHIIKQVQQANQADIKGNQLPCPNCNEPLVERALSFNCIKAPCQFVLWKKQFGKVLSDTQIKTLLTEKETDYIKFKSKNKKDYEAKLRIKDTQTGEIELVFTNKMPSINVTLSKCPKCGNGEVIDKGKLYGCNSYPNCDFFIPKTFLSREFSIDEIKELINQKESGQLDGFISKNGKKFNANVILNENWKLEFDFEEMVK